MPRKILLPAALLALLLAALAMAGRSAGNASADPSLDSEEQAFVTLINNYRAQNGLGPLAVATSLDDSADWMSADMGQRNYFSHTDSLGRDPWTRMCYFGYCYNTYMGENIAAGYQTAQSVFDGWKASPGHNANMLNANYHVMGLARVYSAGSTYGWYWTNDFGGAVPPGTPLSGPTDTPAPTPTTTPAPTLAPTRTPTPTVQPGSACPGDSDCDGWSDAAEARIGTSSVLACSADSVRDNESLDAWPPDFNDDGVSDMADVLTFKAQFGHHSPRWDLNLDGAVNLSDVIMLAPTFGHAC